MSGSSIVALIPARGGSKRVPRKNARRLAGMPLVQWSIRSARDAGIFEQIVVSSDDKDILDAVEDGNVELVLCPEEIAHKDHDPDILWVKHAIDSIEPRPQAFAILRPTSPFRTAHTIRRAWQELRRSEVHSIRAVERAKQHPGKMWLWDGPGMPMKPLLNRQRDDGTPWHSSPTQSLPVVYAQNASLEMAWTYVLESGTISGTKIAPFFTEGVEGFDINTEDDWREAERIASTIGLAHA